jgi:hypothetical protein
MTFQEAYLRTDDWKRKVYIISMYHNSRRHHNKEWKLTDTASYFTTSVGTISEALTLNEHWDLVKNCKSKNEALKKLKYES